MKHCVLDIKVVDSIISAKMMDAKMWRAHPDCPGEISARQYKCLIFEKESWSRDIATDKEIRMSTSGEATAMHALLPLFDTDTGGAASSIGDTSASPLQAAESKREQHTRKPVKLAEHEREKQKNDPKTQAGKWATGLQRDIGGTHAWNDAVEKSTVPNDSKTMYKALFEQKRQELEELQHKLAKATEPEVATSLVKEAPVIVDSYKQLVRRWKKVAAAY